MSSAEIARLTVALRDAEALADPHLAGKLTRATAELSAARLARDVSAFALSLATLCAADATGALAVERSVAAAAAATAKAVCASVGAARAIATADAARAADTIALGVLALDAHALIARATAQVSAAEMAAALEAAARAREEVIIQERASADNRVAAARTEEREASLARELVECRAADARVAAERTAADVRVAEERAAADVRVAAARTEEQEKAVEREVAEQLVSDARFAAARAEEQEARAAAITAALTAAADMAVTLSADAADAERALSDAKSRVALLSAQAESALSQAVAVNKALEMQQAKAEAEAEAKVEAKVEAGLEEARALFALRLADLQNHIECLQAAAIVAEDTKTTTISTTATAHDAPPTVTALMIESASVASQAPAPSEEPESTTDKTHQLKALRIKKARAPAAVTAAVPAPPSPAPVAGSTIFESVPSGLNDDAAAAPRSGKRKAAPGTASGVRRLMKRAALARTTGESLDASALDTSMEGEIAAGADAGVGAVAVAVAGAGAGAGAVAGAGAGADAEEAAVAARPRRRITRAIIANDDDDENDGSSVISLASVAPMNSDLLQNAAAAVAPSSDRRAGRLSLSSRSGEEMTTALLPAVTEVPIVRASGFTTSRPPLAPRAQLNVAPVDCKVTTMPQEFVAAPAFTVPVGTAWGRGFPALGFKAPKLL